MKWLPRVSRAVVPMLLVLLNLGAAQRAQAWGDDGHRIIGRVAEQLVTPQVRERMHAILATDTSGLTPNTSVGEESYWADRYRESDRQGARVHYEATGSWHFVDIELDHPDMEDACYGFPALAAGTPAAEGPAKDCIVHKIEQFAAELGDAKTPQPEQLRALQFLLHFVGDLHQPLHASDDHDRGGNSKAILETTPRRDLHYYWDTAFVRQISPDIETTTAQTLALASGQDRAIWEQGSVRDWAWESFRLSRDRTYGWLPAKSGNGYLLDSAYLLSASEVVRVQLARASIRLALLLQRSLGAEP